MKIGIGGRDALGLYAGWQPGFVGLDQVNTQIPIGLSGLAEVGLSINGRAANPVQVMIRWWAAKGCSDHGHPRFARRLKK